MSSASPSSPAPASSGSSNSKRTPAHDAALLIVKGAACVAFRLPIGRTTRRVKFNKGFSCSVSLGPVAAAPAAAAAAHFAALIENTIEEDKEIISFEVSRHLADKRFKDSYLDEFGIPANVQSVRICAIRDWAINANAFPILRRTGLLEKIEIKEIKHHEAKQTLEISFSFSVVSDLKEKVLQEKDLSLLKHFSEQDLPTLAELLPPSGVETTEDENPQDSQLITPWAVNAEEGKIDYEKLIRRFGCEPITQDLLQLLESATGQRAHHLLRRGLFFSHRDFDLLLKHFLSFKNKENPKKGFPFYLYTGRGPSSESLHIGHLIPFIFTKYLQDVFDVPLVIQLTDDEKFLFKEDLEFAKSQKLAFENAKDIIACGFDVNKTFIFTNTQYMGALYPLVLQIQKKVTYNQVRSLFGFNESDNIGKAAFPAVQAAPAFAAAFPDIFGPPHCSKHVRCLIPQAIDQDPYFRMTRDVACRLGFSKPSLLHSKFIPSLQGFKTKMSGSQNTTCIYVSDSPKQIAEKINKFAFSGGRATVEEHRRLGADLEVDVPFHYLTFFLENDQELETIRTKYSSGEMLTGEVKARLISLLQEIVQQHQERRAKVTDELVREFMNPKRSCFDRFKSQNDKKE